MKNFHELTDRALSAKLNADYTRLAEGRQRFIFEKTLEILNEDGADIRARRAEEARLRQAGLLKPSEELPAPAKGVEGAYKETLDKVRQAGLEKLMDVSDKIGLTDQDMPWTPAMEPLSRAESLMKETDPEKYKELRDKLVQSLVQERKAAFDAGEQNISEKDLLSRVVGKNKDYAQALTRDEYESLSGGVTKPLRIETQDEQGNKVTQAELPRWPGMEAGAAAVYDVGAGAADVLTDPVQLGTAVATGGAFNLGSRALGAVGAKIGTAVASRAPAGVKAAAQAAKPLLPIPLGRARNAAEVGRALGRTSVGAAGGALVTSSGMEAAEKGQLARWSGEMLGSLYPFVVGGRLVDKAAKAYSTKPPEAPKAQPTPTTEPAKAPSGPKFEIPKEVEYRLSPEQMAELEPMAGAVREIPLDPFARLTGQVRQGMPGSRVRKVGGGSEYVSPFNLTKKELQRIQTKGTPVEREVLARAELKKLGQSIGGSVGEKIAQSDTPLIKSVMDRYAELQRAMDIPSEVSPSRGQIEALAGIKDKPLQYRDYWKEYAKKIVPPFKLPSLPPLPSDASSTQIQPISGEIQTTKPRRRDSEKPSAPSETAPAPEVKVDFNAPGETPFAEISPRPDYANTGEVLRAFGLKPEVFRATRGRQGGAFTATIPEAPPLPEPKTTLSVSDISAIERAGKPPESILSRAAREASAKPAEAPPAKPEISPKPSEVTPETIEAKLRELSPVSFKFPKPAQKPTLGRVAAAASAVPGVAGQAVPQLNIADIFKPAAEVRPAIEVSVPKWAEMTREPLEVMNGEQIARIVANMAPKMEAPKVSTKPISQEPRKVDFGAPEAKPSSTAAEVPAWAVTEKPAKAAEPTIDWTKIIKDIQIQTAEPETKEDQQGGMNRPVSLPDEEIAKIKELQDKEDQQGGMNRPVSLSDEELAKIKELEEPETVKASITPPPELLPEPSKPSGVSPKPPSISSVLAPFGLSTAREVKQSEQPTVPEQPVVMPSGPSPAAEVLPEPSIPAKTPPKQTPSLPPVVAPTGLPKAERPKQEQQPSSPVSDQQKAPAETPQEKPRDITGEEGKKKETAPAPAPVNVPNIPQTTPITLAPAAAAVAAIIGSLPFFGEPGIKGEKLKAKGQKGQAGGGLPPGSEEGFGEEGEAERDQPGLGTKDWNLLMKDIYSKYAGTLSK